MGLDRSALLSDLGVAVVTLPLEIHPEIPVGGLSLAERWGNRYAEATAMYARIEAECEAAGLPFNRPERVPNTRRALATAAWVRREKPEAADSLERALFEAHFVYNRPLDDPDVVDGLVAGSGADAADARRAYETGEMDAALKASWELARDLQVHATPTWLIDRRAFVRGARPRADFVETVSRLASSDPA